MPYLPSLMQKLISHHSPTCSLCSSYYGLLLFLQNARHVSVSGPFRLPFPLPAELAPDFTGVSALMLPHQTGLLTTLCEAGPLPLSILLLVFFSNTQHFPVSSHVCVFVVCIPATLAVPRGQGFCLAVSATPGTGPGIEQSLSQYLSMKERMDHTHQT